MTATMTAAVVMFIGTAPPLALPPLAVGTGGREQGRRPQLKEPKEGSYHHQSKRRSEGAIGFVCAVCVQCGAPYIVVWLLDPTSHYHVGVNKALLHAFLCPHAKEEKG